MPGGRCDVKDPMSKGGGPQRRKDGGEAAPLLDPGDANLAYRIMWKRAPEGAVKAKATCSFKIGEAIGRGASLAASCA